MEPSRRAASICAKRNLSPHFGRPLLLRQNPPTRTTAQTHFFFLLFFFFFFFFDFFFLLSCLELELLLEYDAVLGGAT